MRQKEFLLFILFFTCIIISVSLFSGTKIYASGCQSIVIPAYFYPDWYNNPNYWNTAITTGKPPVAYMVMNPNSGPGTSSNSDYVHVVDSAQTAGIKVIGYVDTNYAARSLATVEGEIDSYMSWYSVNGIFFDRVSSNESDELYYQSLKTYVKNISASKKVVLNNGTVPPAAYFSIGDLVVVFEGTYTTYQSTTFPSWLATYNNQAIYLVYEAPDTTAMQDVLNTSAIQNVYVTDDGADGNPWDSLPTYWSSLSSAVLSECHGMPRSTNFAIQSYSFGSGGTDSNTKSSNYGLYGVSGEVEFGKPFSANFQVGSGLNYLINANVPGTPTISNPGTTYDRLKIVLNTSNNPTDTTYAIQLSTTSDFSSNVLYVKTDGTTGSTLTASDFQTYVNWGGASGTIVTTLKPNTTYYFRVAARQGNYTQTEWGPSASGATQNPILTFTLGSNTVAFSPLNGANSYTDSSKSTTLTTTTNAYNGYNVYAKETISLTSPQGSTISDYISPNSAPTAWSGTGFGYTTDNTTLSGDGGPNRFNNGTYYAGFVTSATRPTDPGDPVATHNGPVTSEIVNETYTVSYRITATNTTPAETYGNVILYTIVPSY